MTSAIPVQRSNQLSDQAFYFRLSNEKSKSNWLENFKPKTEPQHLLLPISNFRIQLIPLYTSAFIVFVLWSLR